LISRVEKRHIHITVSCLQNYSTQIGFAILLSLLFRLQDIS